MGTIGGGAIDSALDTEEEREVMALDADDALETEEDAGAEMLEEETLLEEDVDEEIALEVDAGAEVELEELSIGSTFTAAVFVVKV